LRVSVVLITISLGILMLLIFNSSNQLLKLLTIIMLAITLFTNALLKKVLRGDENII